MRDDELGYSLSWVGMMSVVEWNDVRVCMRGCDMRALRACAVTLLGMDLGGVAWVWFRFCYKERKEDWFRVCVRMRRRVCM